MADITSANSTLLIGISGLFTVPQQLQGFSADDAYEMAAVDNKEISLGVDGVLSAGWIPAVKVLSVTLQADSASNTFFETWFASEEAARTPYFGFGVITQPSINRIYTLTNGVLKNYTPLAQAAKTLRPRKFEIHFQTVLGAPT
ncbi:phage tail fiber protein [Paraburkholderia sp. RL18-085-BIA-A]|uniref:phage tail fiber protein n=1 Tax=Paraburkholderia sp. RL18-085-BIA-A TaxID=3031633 RepID=UPI0038BB6F56